MGETSGCGCGWRHGTPPGSVGAVETAYAPVRPEDTVEATARRFPRVLPILQGFGIDTCCGGHLTLAQAAAGAGVPVETVLHALEPTRVTT